MCTHGKIWMWFQLKICMLWQPLDQLELGHINASLYVLKIKQDVINVQTCYLKLHPLGLLPGVDFLNCHECVWPPLVGWLIFVFVAWHFTNCLAQKKSGVSLSESRGWHSNSLESHEVIRIWLPSREEKDAANQKQKCYSSRYYN